MRALATAAAVACGVAVAVPATSASAAAAATTTAGAGTVVLVDRHTPWSYGGDGSTGSSAYGSDAFGSDAYGSPYASGATSTAVSTAATSAQSAGVVLIETVLPYENGEAAGTGMVLTSDGEVLTNYHVVEGAGTIQVTVASTGQSYAATVVGTDKTDDVALLKLTGASGLTTVKADDDATALGQTVTAVGNAGGTGTLTAATGTISSVTASVTAASETGSGSETLGSMIETTADVVAGDSGGPLFDAEGEVVGIDTAASTGYQIDGYAIPIARALAVVAQIQSGTGTSTVRIGPAAFLGVELTSRGTVAGVVSGSAAAAAGLQAGDVLTTLNGTSLTSGSSLSAALVTANPGDQVTVGWTDTAGATHTATVTLGASPVA